MRLPSKVTFISILIFLGITLVITASPSIADTDASSESLAPSQPVDANSRATAAREGKWPAQVAASRGDIAPDRHGP